MRTYTTAVPAAGNDYSQAGRKNTADVFERKLLNSAVAGLLQRCRPVLRAVLLTVPSLTLTFATLMRPSISRSTSSAKASHVGASLMHHTHHGANCDTHARTHTHKSQQSRQIQQQQQQQYSSSVRFEQTVALVPDRFCSRERHMTWHHIT